MALAEKLISRGEEGKEKTRTKKAPLNLPLLYQYHAWKFRGGGWARPLPADGPSIYTTGKIIAEFLFFDSV